MSKRNKRLYRTYNALTVRESAQVDQAEVNLVKICLVALILAVVRIVF